MKIHFAKVSTYLQMQYGKRIYFSPLNKKSEEEYYQIWSGGLCREKLHLLPLLSRYPFKLLNFHGLIIDDLSLFPKDINNISLLIEASDKKVIDKIKNYFHLITSLEKDLELNESILKVHSEYGVVIDINPFWNTSPLLISIFSMLIRILGNSTITNLKKGIDKASRFYLSETNQLKLEAREELGIRKVLENIEVILGDNPLTLQDDDHLICTLFGEEYKEITVNPFSKLFKKVEIYDGKENIEKLNMFEAIQFQGYYTLISYVNSLLYITKYVTFPNRAVYNYYNYIKGLDEQ